MDFLPDSDQVALVEATREYVDSRFPLVASPARLDDVRWKELAQLGWLGLATDEPSGGAGATLLDEVFVFKEVGRGLVGGPILTTLAAARLAAWTGNPTLSGDLISGQQRVARAVPLPGDDQRLLLLDSDGSSFVLLVDEDQIALYPSLDHVHTTPGLEDGTTVAQLTRASLGSPTLGTDVPHTIGRLRRVLSILTSAQLAGIAAATRDLAASYAKDRVQFGKPIGAFQAIKHKCADMATNALAAENLTFFAALAEGSPTTDSRYHALAAAAFTRRAAYANARANVQIHGAMGFTVEDSAHRFVKRTHTLCATEGFDRAAERLGGLPGDDTSEES